MNGGIWRPLGFLLLMLGFGLRLDTDWLGLATCLLVCGTVGAGAGLWTRGRDANESAFVPPARGR